MAGTRDHIGSDKALTQWHGFLIMIDRTLQAEADHFLSVFQPTLSGSAITHIDLSYPSLGLLDMILLPTRGIAEGQSALDPIIRGVSIHLAIYLHQTLQRLGVNTEVVDSDKGTLLRAPTGFLGSNGQTQEVSLEKSLHEVLRHPEKGVPVFVNFTRVIPASNNWLTPIALGILLGSSGFISPCEQEITDEYMAEQGQKVLSELARQCVEWYERVFPQEQLGQVAELYLNKLIFPPFQFREEVPAVEAVRGLKTFADEYSLSSASLLPLCRNLSQCPDEQISSAALCLLATLDEQSPTSEMFATCRRHGSFVGLLREALVEANQLFFQRPDWILSADPYSEREKLRIQRETRLGFIPWLRLPFDVLYENPENQNLSFLLRSLADFDVARSVAVCEKILEEYPGEIPFRMQRIFLCVVAGDVEDALLRAKQLLTEPESESHPGVYNLLGMIQLLLNQATPALQSFETARKFATNDPTLAAEIGNNYAWALLAHERYEDALDSLDFSLMGAADNLILRLNRISALIRLGRRDDADMEEKRLLALAPLHPRVFYAVTQPAYAKLTQATH